MAAKPPEHHPSSLPPATSFSSSILIHQSPTSSKSSPTIDFSPPLIAMVVVAAAAFLFITYSRLISHHIFPPFLRLYHHHRRRRFLPSSDLGSPPGPYQSSDGFYVYSPYPYPYGLDDSVIKNIPLTKLKFIELDEDEFHFHDCAVCLVDFQEGECIRTLPHCCHPFHVDCIDMWLRSHATCPLCRAGVFLSPPSDSSHPHVQLSPVMAARVRPSFDQGILLESMFLEPLQEVVNNYGEIQEMEIFSPESERRAIQSEDHQSSSNNRRELDFLLKRSYSFGFERRSSYPSESDQRVVMESATTPYHHHRQRRSFFWRKQRPSSSLTPFRSMAKSRVFSLRRTMKSQSPACFRRKGYISIWECSESESLEIEYGSSRRMKGSPGPFSSSRMRLGDPEALISPERYNRHRR